MRMSLLPPELFTLFSSSLTGSFIRLVSRSIEVRRQERLFTLQALKNKMSIIEQARRYDNLGHQWTRRVISLIAVFFVIVYPKLIAVFFPHIAVHVGYHQLCSGFLFHSSGEKVNWISFQGLVITPLDTHLVSAIIGLYFGGALANNR